jgi:DNA-binding NarL/FixJ family response regulator
MVADDNPVMLRSVIRLLTTIPGVKVIGEANSGRDLLKGVAELHPDLVLVDLTMPGIDGLEATRQLSAQSRAPVIIMITVHDLPEYREAARSAGAHDFLVKSELSWRLEPAIRRLLPDCFLKSDGWGSS